MPEFASLTSISDRAHKSRGATRGILEAANVAQDAGRFDLDAALAAIEARGDPSKQLGQQAAGRGAALRKAAQHVTGLAAARERSELARARKLEIENQKAEGDLLSRAVVVEAGKHFAAHVRAGLTSFGASVAPSLVGRNAAEIATAIDGAMSDLLTRLGDVESFILDRELA